MRVTAAGGVGTRVAAVRIAAEVVAVVGDGLEVVVDKRVAIIGVGNCASSLVQGVQFYKDAPEDIEVPGLMHVNLGGYHVREICSGG